jgi:hypothetical protein
VVKTSGPIDCSVRRAGGKLARASERSASIHLAKVVHIRKYWTILDTIERVDKVLHIILVPRSHPADNDSVSTKTWSYATYLLGKKIYVLRIVVNL